MMRELLEFAFPLILVIIAFILARYYGLTCAKKDIYGRERLYFKRFKKSLFKTKIEYHCEVYSDPYDAMFDSKFGKKGGWIQITKAEYEGRDKRRFK